MRIFFMICMMLALVACSNLTKEKLGIAKDRPNENVVERRTPLDLPPEFDLRPVTNVDNKQG